MRGEKGHDIVRSGLEILVNLTHRGACGCDPLTGDGGRHFDADSAGILRRQGGRNRHHAARAGEYGVGTMFLPRDEAERRHCEQRFEAITAEEGQVFLGWRDVPIDNSVLGHSARDVEPVIRQMFVARGPKTPADMLEWKLFVIRKRHANEINAQQPVAKAILLRSQPVEPRGDLQRLAVGRPGRAVLRRP